MADVPAHVDELLRAACYRKSEYADKATALHAGRRMMRQPDYDGTILTVYRCPVYKNHWHLGRKLGSQGGGERLEERFEMDSANGGTGRPHDNGGGICGPT